MLAITILPNENDSHTGAPVHDVLGGIIYSTICCMRTTNDWKLASSQHEVKLIG